jgi:hypothetical protein
MPVQQAALIIPDGSPPRQAQRRPEAGIRIQEAIMSSTGRPVPASLGLLAVAIALAGCSEALTVHPVALPVDPAPDVPALAGTWIWGGSDGASDGTRVEIVGSDQPGQRCRRLTVTFLEGDTRHELGDELCLVEFNGHLVAELRDDEWPSLYRQYLVRSHDDRFELCGAGTVWLALAELPKEYPVGYSLESLQYTVRQQGDSQLMMLVSDSKSLREFLTLALPELAAFCDTAKTDELRWVGFVRAEETGPGADD